MIEHVVNGRRLVCAVGVILSGAATLTFGRAAAADPIVMAAPSVRVMTCVPGYQSIAVPIPSAAGATSVSGQVLVVNGVQLAGPIALVNGTATLPLGLHEVAWTATASDGTTTTFQQALRVEEDVSAACCAPGQTHVQGTDAADALIKLLPKPWCVLAAGGPDVVTTGAKADFISGGDGDDALSSLGGADAMSGGRGADAIVGAAGAVRLYGGPGNDLLDAKRSSSVTLFGDEGDDLIFGSPGDDVIVPGPGRDVVTAGAGNDRVEILDLSEVEAGELLSGGAGTDTLVTPIPLVQLLARGVIVTGFENIVVDATRSYLSESVTGSPLVVTATPGPMRISLEWAWLGSTTPPTSFEVQRSLDGAIGTYTTLASGVTAGAFTDDTLRNGVEACYRLAGASGGATVTSTPVCSAGVGPLTAAVGFTATPFDETAGGSDLTANVYVADLPGSATSPGAYSYVLAYQFDVTHLGQSADDTPSRSLRGLVSIAEPGSASLRASWDGANDYGRTLEDDPYRVAIDYVALLRGPSSAACEALEGCLRQGFELISGTPCASSPTSLMDNDWCPVPIPDIGHGGYAPLPIVVFKTLPHVASPATKISSATTVPYCALTPVDFAPQVDMGSAFDWNGDTYFTFADANGVWNPAVGSFTPYFTSHGANDDVFARLLGTMKSSLPTAAQADAHCFAPPATFLPVPYGAPSPIILQNALGDDIPLGPGAIPLTTSTLTMSMSQSNHRVYGMFAPGSRMCDTGIAGVCAAPGVKANDVCVSFGDPNNPSLGYCAFLTDPSDPSSPYAPRAEDGILAEWSAGPDSTLFRQNVSVASPNPFTGRWASPTALVEVDDPTDGKHYVYAYGRDRFLGDPNAGGIPQLYLMRLPYDPLANVFGSPSYFRGLSFAALGNSVFGNEGEAQPVYFDKDQLIVNHTSVAPIQSVNGRVTWVMLYGGRVGNFALSPQWAPLMPTLTREQIVHSPGIRMRTAPAPEGPWSEPVTLFNPFWQSSGGYCPRRADENAIMHYTHFLTDNITDVAGFGCAFPQDDTVLDHQNVASLTSVPYEWGAEYGVSIVPQLSRTVPGVFGPQMQLTWMMSTWDPYRVVLMQSSVAWTTY